jgi:hypothetical protein
MTCFAIEKPNLPHHHHRFKRPFGAFNAERILADWKIT